MPASTLHPRPASTLQLTWASSLQPVPASAVGPLPVSTARPDASRTAASSVWTATGHERPVFLDERGTRRRWVGLGGALLAAAAALWLGGLVAGTVGFSSLPSWRALPSAAQASGMPYRLVARVAKVNRSVPLIRDVELVVRWRAGPIASRSGHPGLVAERPGGRRRVAAASHGGLSRATRLAQSS